MKRLEHELLVQLIYRHVLGGESITKVAASLEMTRAKAHALLREATERGYIETTTTLEADPLEELGLHVRRHWAHTGLEDVHVLAGPADDRTLERDDKQYGARRRRNLGALAARYAANLPLQEGAHMVLGGGRTMATFAMRFVPPVRNLVIRPLAIGGRWRSVGHLDDSATIQLLQLRLGFPFGEGVTTVCPEVPPGPLDVGDRERPELQAVFGKMAPRPAVTICSIGGRKYFPVGEGLPAPDPRTSGFVQLYAAWLFYKSHQADLRKKPELVYQPLPDAAYREAALELKQRGVIGNLYLHGLTASGETRQTLLDETIVTVGPDRLRQWRKEGANTVLIAGGTFVGPVLRAALLGGFFRTAILDVAAAVQALPLDERPVEYRDVQLIDDVDFESNIPNQRPSDSPAARRSARKRR